MHPGPMAGRHCASASMPRMAAGVRHRPTASTREPSGSTTIDGAGRPRAMTSTVIDRASFGSRSSIGGVSIGHRSGIDAAPIPCSRMAKRCVDASPERRSRAMRDDPRCEVDARCALRCRDGRRHHRRARRRTAVAAVAHGRLALRRRRIARRAARARHARPLFTACRKALLHAALRRACGFSLVSSPRPREGLRRVFVNVAASCARARRPARRRHVDGVAMRARRRVCRRVVAACDACLDSASRVSLHRCVRHRKARAFDGVIFWNFFLNITDQTNYDSP